MCLIIFGSPQYLTRLLIWDLQRIKKDPLDKICLLFASAAQFGAHKYLVFIELLIFVQSLLHFCSIFCLIFFCILRVSQDYLFGVTRLVKDQKKFVYVLPHYFNLVQKSNLVFY